MAASTGFFAIATATAGLSTAFMTDYVELRAQSAFSFLEAASSPEDLAEQAATLGLKAVALVDTQGVYGAPRFFKAAKAAGVRALVGAQLTLEAAIPTRLSFLVGSQKGYRNLCQMITAGALGKEKGKAAVSWEQIETYAGDLYCLSDELHLDRLVSLFPSRVYVELQRHGHVDQERHNQRLMALAESFHLPLVATNGVRYALSKDKDILDVLTCIRHHTTLDKAGQLLEQHREARLKSAAEMNALFSDLPQALRGTQELAEKLNFTLDNLGYRVSNLSVTAGGNGDVFLAQNNVGRCSAAVCDL